MIPENRSQGRLFQTEGTASSEALRWGHAWQLNSKEASVAGVRKIKREKVVGDGV